MDVLSAEEFEKGLKTRSLGRRVIVLDMVDSTNLEVRKMLECEPSDGLVVIADRQTGGRGRRGRRWVSEAGCGLWMSFSAKPNVPREHIQQVTLAAGVAVCAAVEELTGGAVKPLIKWPNDVVIEGKKVCGILCEAILPLSPSVTSPSVRGTGDCGILGSGADLASLTVAALRRDIKSEGGGSTGPEGVPCVVVGIGVNTRRPRDGWGEAEGVAVSMEEAAGILVPRMHLAAEILNRMEALLDALASGGFAAIAGEYRKRMLPPGSEVVLMDGGKQRRGRIEGVDDAGGLLVRLESGVLERVISGEIGVRGVEGYV